MTAAIPIRRAVIVSDLVLQGWAESARRIYRRVRTLERLSLVVWVDNAGMVWIRGVDEGSKFAPPAGQHLATYKPSVPINEIEDDMLFHLRSMTNTRKAA